VNVRALPEPRSEVIFQLSKERRITVLEDVAGPRVDGSEGMWSRIVIPSGTPLWVFADFVDPDSGEVTVDLLNIRAGKGEEHAILGKLLMGDRVESLAREGDWLKIKAPIGAYGYVASEYLETVKLRVGSADGPASDDGAAAPEGPASQPALAADAGVPGAVESPVGPISEDGPLPAAEPEANDGMPTLAMISESPTAPGEPPPPATVFLAESPVGEAAPVVAASSSSSSSTPETSEGVAVPDAGAEPSLVLAPVTAEEPSPSTPASGPLAENPATPPEQAVVSVEPVAPVPLEAVVAVDSRPEAPVRRRIAIREGIVKRTLSIQAPGAFELCHSATGDRLVYLHPAEAKMDLKRFHRRRVRVRGQEFIDPRWPNCAVLFVERISLAP
jgi:hypothetical protein